AGWAGLHDGDEQVLGAVDVKPELPWHGYKADQFDAEALAHGKTISMRFDLEPTSWLFKKGHKIRVSIAGVDKRNFELNKASCSTGEIESCMETILSFHREEGMRSNIELPIIPNVPASSSTAR
ncbi:MAG: hypothetical protein COA82_13405, partial [Alkaliphilus sp.]